MSEVTPLNCVEVIDPFVRELNDRGLMDDFQLMGGIGSAVLRHEGTEILPDEQLIVAPKGFLDDNENLTLLRPAGTRRDMDALILSSDPEYIAEIEALADKMVGPHLDVSVFGLRGAEHLDRQLAQPFGMVSLKAWVSDRYVRPNGSLQKALTPFSVPMPKESVESWTAIIEDKAYPVANPASAVASYLTRSISGLRPKDFEKVQEVAARLKEKWPEAAEWLVDGPGASQMALAGIFHTLRRDNMWNGTRKRELNVGNLIRIKARDVRALTEHEAFMYRDADADTQRRVLNMAIFKARLLGTAESNPAVVHAYQKHVERRMDSVVKNK